jgi:hypothetical protein
MARRSPVGNDRGTSADLPRIDHSRARTLQRTTSCGSAASVAGVARLPSTPPVPKSAVLLFTFNVDPIRSNVLPPKPNFLLPKETFLLNKVHADSFKKNVPSQKEKFLLPRSNVSPSKMNIRLEKVYVDCFF